MSTNPCASKERRASRRLRLESLESRQLMAADLDITPNAQLLIELINRARANPTAEAVRLGIGLNDRVPAESTISTAAKQPLAPHQALVDAAVAHASDMLERNYFDHFSPAPNSTSPSDRAIAAGYPVGAGENIAWRGSTGAIDETDYVYLLHDDLFHSWGHRVNMLVDYYREIGTGVEYGVFNMDGTNYNSGMVAEAFGVRAGNAFITGVAYNDSVVADDFYTIGEAEAGLIVRATNEAGATYQTTTASSGGYSLQVPDGAYFVTFVRPATGSTASVGQFMVDGQNVKVDFDSSEANFAVAPTVTVSIDQPGSNEDGGEDLIYTFHRSGQTDASLTVQFVVSGTATGEDYSYSGATISGNNGQITFAAGSNQAQFIVEPFVDEQIESDESLIVTISHSADYETGDNDTVVGTIFNDDFAALIIDGGLADDVIIVDLASRTYSVNGAVSLISASVSDISVHGKSGADKLSVVGSDSISSAQFRVGALLVTDGALTFTADSVEHTSVSMPANAEADTLMFDSSGDDRFKSVASQATMVGTGFSYELTGGYQSVEAYATAGGRDVAFLYDSAGDDRVVSDYDRVTMLAANVTASARDFEQVNAYASAGTDLAIVNDSPADDVVKFYPEYTLVRVDAVDRYTMGFDQTNVYANNGGSDFAVMYDSFGNDTLRAYPTYTEMSGPGFKNYAFHFEQVNSYSKAGGKDIARLFDSTGDDIARAHPTHAQIIGSGFANYAFHFDQTHTSATAGGYDSMFLHDSSGDDAFVASPSSAQMTGMHFANYSTGFDQVYGRAQNGGHDLAELYDSVGNDALVAQANSVQLTGVNFASYATGFDQVNGYANAGGRDLATLYDSASDDTLLQHPAYSKISNADVTNFAFGFDQVNGYANNGGSDIAVLHDSAGDDQLIAYSDFTRLYGEGFNNYAFGFEQTNGYANAGGNDVAFLYDSVGDDVLTVAPNWARMQSAGRNNYVFNFEQVNGYAVYGGSDTANLSDSSGNDVFVRTPSYSSLRGGGFNSYAINFEIVVATASTGDDVATLYDSSGDDRLENTAGVAQLTSSGGSTVRVVNFDSVIARAVNGGTNLLQQHPIDFLFSTVGDWQSI